MLKVVCVDDEKQSLQHLVSLCRNIPEIAAVKSFGKCGEALAWIESHPCDLILLEISMPEMDGITLARKIREIRPDTDIVFVTAHSEYAIDTWSIHPSGFIVKPVTQKTLQEEVDYVLSFRSRRISG